jgi:DNA-binding YbaB/EbfC family protein
MKNMFNVMKQAQQMKKNMEDMQQRLGDITMEGTAGNGLVVVTMSGKSDVRRVKIDPKAAADLETLEDLIAAAVNDAQTKVQAYINAEVSKITGGMSLPGF